MKCENSERKLSVADVDDSADVSSSEAQASGPANLEVDALPAVMTPDEVAALLRLNRKTIYDLIRRGELPGARRFGRSIRVSRDAVLDWLRGQGRVSSARSKR